VRAAAAAPRAGGDGCGLVVRIVGVEPFEQFVVQTKLAGLYGRATSRPWPVVWAPAEITNGDIS
jgi:hypothetical protein